MTQESKLGFRRRWRQLMMVAIYLAIAANGRSDLTVTNSAGVRAGITGIVYYPSVKSVGVNFAVNDPTGTNVTSFTIQTNSALKGWADFSSTITVTGSFGPSQIAAPATNMPSQFYRMRLINFQ
jgi:hypothetical protein